MNSEAGEFAGFGPDSIKIYAEHVGEEDLSEEAAQLLTNDINYKLRHVLQTCLTKCKKMGRQTITSVDVDEVFADLSIGKVYGAPSSPTWISTDDERGVFYFLNDQPVNLIEIAEEELNLQQSGGVIIEQDWLISDDSDNSETHSNNLAQYFAVVCETVISDDNEARHAALLDLSTNPSIGPIAYQFYNFSFFMLLEGNVSVDLNMRILSLLEVLENSPMPNLTASSQQLRMIIKLLLERSLLLPMEDSVVKCSCYVLSLFCLRPEMKTFALRILEEKLSMLLPLVADRLLNIIYYLGIDAVKQLFIPSIMVFLNEAVEIPDPEMTDILLSIYGLICKADLNTDFVSEAFQLAFDAGDRALFLCYKQEVGKIEREVLQTDAVKVMTKRAKTRRKMYYKDSKGEQKFVIVGKTCDMSSKQITKCSTHLLFITL